MFVVVTVLVTAGRDSVLLPATAGACSDIVPDVSPEIISALIVSST